MNFVVYTDGSCLKNPGPGGWAYYYVGENNKFSTSAQGYEENTTNNRMELKSIYMALKAITCSQYCPRKDKYTIDVYTDSAYCYNPLTKGWLDTWSKNEWKTKSGDEVKNLDLWMKLNTVLKQTDFKVAFHKVKGHSGNEYNEFVDKLAKNAASMAKQLIKEENGS